jgi:hypothetical protein
MDNQADGYKMTLEDAARQALWDLKEWVKDHPTDCECFTCRESIPDLEETLTEPEENG